MMAQKKTVWRVYYRGHLLDETRAVSREKAINNTRWNHFLSQRKWAEIDDFDAVEM